MPRRGRYRKKTRTHKPAETDEHASSALKSREEIKVPKSLVIRRGKVEDEVAHLQRDLRRLMLPHTAIKFKEDPTNRKATLSRYARNVCAPMGITHILSLSQNGPSVNLRIARSPIGPTLTFKVERFALAKHVRSVQRRPYDSKTAFQHAPVVVTNNFGGGGGTGKGKGASTVETDVPPHIKLMRITFQNMFPAVNVSTVRLTDCRRVVLFNLIRRRRRRRSDSGDGAVDEERVEGNESAQNKKEGGGVEEEEEEEEEYVEVRHYAVKATPVGVNRRVRRIVQARAIPNLSKLDDVADYVTGRTASGEPAASASGYVSGGNASDSEPEDETSHVVLSQRFTGRGNARSQTSALKLVELGPRLRLRLFKVQRGLDEGDVMYHAYVKKSPEEAREKREKVRAEAEEKKRRREEQESNVRRKAEARDEKREAKRRRKEERERKAMEELRGGGREGEDAETDSEGEEEDDVMREDEKSVSSSGQSTAEESNEQ